MKKSKAVSLVSLVCLFGTALILHLGNSAEPLPPQRNETELTRMQGEMIQQKREEERLQRLVGQEESPLENPYPAVLY